MLDRTKNILLMFEAIAIIFLVGYTVNADFSVQSESVYYQNKNMTVNDSLNDLESKLGDVDSIGTANNVDILETKSLYVKGKVVEGAMTNYSGKTVTRGE